MTMQQLYLVVPLVPLVASIVVGLWGSKMPRAASHWITILAVAISFVASVVICPRRAWPATRSTATSTSWANAGDLKMAIGFLIDPLTALMLIVVTFVSLMVHVYTIGYMADDDGYSRFFSLHLPVHVLDAHAGHEQQLPAALLRLGGGGARLVPADRLLVQAADGDLREPEGIHRQPCRRLRLHPRHRPRPRVSSARWTTSPVFAKAPALAATHDQPVGRRRMVAA